MKMFKISVLMLVLFVVTMPLWAQVINPETPEDAWGVAVVGLFNAVLPFLIIKITGAVPSKTWRFIVAAGFTLASVFLYFIIQKIPISFSNMAELFGVGFFVAQLGWRTWFKKITNPAVT